MAQTLLIFKNSITITVKLMGYLRTGTSLKWNNRDPIFKTTKTINTIHTLTHSTINITQTTITNSNNNSIKTNPIPLELYLEIITLILTNSHSNFILNLNIITICMNRIHCSKDRECLAISF